MTCAGFDLAYRLGFIVFGLFASMAPSCEEGHSSDFDGYRSLLVMEEVDVVSGAQTGGSVGSSVCQGD